MDKPRSPEVVAFWQGFLATRGIADQPYDVCRIADLPDLANELTDLILGGRKRGTACLMRDIEAGVETMARVGGHVVVVDAGGRPRAIWRTRTVEVKPLEQVDDAFAWDEGEGERTRDDWLAQHIRYYSRRAATEGFAFSPSMPTVFERFTVVWPPQYADTE